MTVWLVLVNGKVDRVYATSSLASDRIRQLKTVNCDQVSVYCQEQKVVGYTEENVL